MSKAIPTRGLKRLLPALEGQTESQYPRSERGQKPREKAWFDRVTSACLACKERKTKCSGEHPCSKCLAKKTECIFDTEADGRTKSHRTRLDQISKRQRDLLARLLLALRSGSKDRIEEIGNVCRREISWDQLEEDLRALVFQDEGLDIHEPGKEPEWWKDLMQGTSLSDNTRREVVGDLQTADVGSSSMVAPINPAPFSRLSSTSWTTVTNDQSLILHLISLYFVWEHQTLPFLDRQLFFEDFESGANDFCSSLLVNAICALGSRFSNRPEICPLPAEGGLKGAIFEAEAHRLWSQDDRQPRLTTIQALCLLGWRIGADGRDRQGRSLLRDAAAMSFDLRLHKDSTSQKSNEVQFSSLSVKRLQRGKMITVWALRNWSVIHSTAVMRPVINIKVPTDRSFPTTDLYHGTEWWRPYPVLDDETRPSYFWQIFEAWCLICDIAQEFISRLYPDHADPDNHIERFPSLAEADMYIERLQGAEQSLIEILKAKDCSPDLPHVIQFRSFTAGYCLILYNAIYEESPTICDRIFQWIKHIIWLVGIYKQKYGLEYAQGLLTHPLIVVCYSLIDRLNEPDAQALLEASLHYMLDMANHVTLLTAVVQAFWAMARNVGVKWTESSGLDIALRKMATIQANLAADYAILSPKVKRGDVEDEGVLRLTELLENLNRSSIENES